MCSRFIALHFLQLKFVSLRIVLIEHVQRAENAVEGRVFSVVAKVNKLLRRHVCFTVEVRRQVTTVFDAKPKIISCTVDASDFTVNLSLFFIT